MKKVIFTVVLSFVFGTLVQASAQTKQKITVQINQQKTVAKTKLAIKFASLIEDSRCPTGTNCIQAGNAKITIQVGKSKGAMKTFELNTNSKQQAVSYAGYEIKLTDLNPKPASNIRINRNGYTATFVVSKSGNTK